MDYHPEFLGEMNNKKLMHDLETIEKKVLCMYGENATPLRPNPKNLDRIAELNENVIVRQIDGGDHGTPLYAGSKDLERLTDLSVSFFENRLYA
jgi:hypothetical protein